ncbi:MAG: DHH family phosphoesterase [Oligoflexia bacterium]|nr:DHH family phosphoesterase [Oligoflexia bacterium]
MRQINNLKKLIYDADTIILTTHIIPDADGIGGQVALYQALKLLGKKVFAVNEEPLHQRWKKIFKDLSPVSYKKFKQEFKQEFKQDKKNKCNKCNAIDLFILIDANSSERIGHRMQNLLGISKKFICIDHHPLSLINKTKNTTHFIDSTAAATAEIIAKLIKHLHIKYSKEMALALYSAIIIDTSSFRYPNVTFHTHKLISELLKTGINPAVIYDQIYGAKSPKHFQLLGKILGNVKITSDQQIAYLIIPQKLLGKYDVDEEDTYSYINYLLVLDKIKIVCLFRELKRPKGYIKLSIRSNFQKEHLDAGKMAANLGGGGHNHSAAAIIKGSLNKVITQTLVKIRGIILDL